MAIVRYKTGFDKFIVTKVNVADTSKPNGGLPCKQNFTDVQYTWKALFITTV
jgi:hypothetical protein